MNCLVGDYIVIIDNDDFEKLNQYKWYILNSGRTLYIAGRKRFEKYAKLTYLHNLVSGSEKPFITDHINRNTLDNRKSNLRICNYSDNGGNSKSAKNSSSNYLGVSKSKNIFISRIKKNYKNIYIGCFNNEVEAALAYDKAAKEIHGEFANLNFK